MKAYGHTQVLGRQRNFCGSFSKVLMYVCM